MAVLKPIGRVDGDSKEPLGTTIDAAWTVAQSEALKVSVAKILLRGTTEEFIFGRSWV